MIEGIEAAQSAAWPFVVTPRWEWVCFVSILCLAAALRLWCLDCVPPGLTHDEAGHGQDALAILRGARPLYETIGYGREPLYDYLVAGAFALLGRTDHLVLREVSAVFGLLTIAAAYLWVRRAFGRGEAILVGAWLAGSFWAVSVSRQALRSTMLPALLAAAVYAWWRGTFDPRDSSGSRDAASHRGWARGYWGWFVLAGLLVGATLWNYMAARVTWALFLALPLFLLVTDRERFRRRWPGMLLTLLVAGIVSAPMFIWLWQHPGAEQRFSQLDRPLRLLASGDVGQLWANSVGALGMFTFRGDDLWVYNVPGRPWLGVVEGVLFYAGLALALWRWRRPQHALALTWLVLGILPSVITGVSASTTRAVAALPVLYLFPALALTEAFRWLGSRGTHRRTRGRTHDARAIGNGVSEWRCPQRPHYPLRITHHASRITSASAAILAASLVLFAGIRTCHDYFSVWGNARDVRASYHATLLEMGREMDGWAVPSGTPVVVSSIYPGRFHDPYALELIMARRDLSLRWVDGRGALVFPDSDGPPASCRSPSSASDASTPRLIVKALAPLDPALERIVAAPHADLVASRVLRPDDVNPGFDVYEWDSGAGLEALLSRAASCPAAWSGAATLPADDPQSAYRALDLPADLGHAVALLGCEVSSPVVAPGDEIIVITIWRVLSSPKLAGEERSTGDLETVLFTHVLNPAGDPPVVAQQDRLDAPSWNWHPGDAFAQVHRVVIDADVPCGDYPLEVGAYTRAIPSPVEPDPPAKRLALYVGGQAVSDRILLPPLQVECQGER